MESFIRKHILWTMFRKSLDMDWDMTSVNQNIILEALGDE